MKYRRLGSTQARVSVVGVGTWQLGGEWGHDYVQSEADAIFDAAREVGIDLIDTAECYGDHSSEAFVGRAIERDRDRWFVATKFGHRFHGPFDRTEPRRPQDVRVQLEDSLAALRTDRIDLYQYHSFGDAHFFDEDVLALLHQLQGQGKIRFLGNSVGPNDRVEQVAVSKQRSIQTIQIVHNRLNRAAEAAVFPSCIEQDLGVLARVPLASGYLSGKYRPGHVFPAGEVRSRHEEAVRERQLEEVARIAREEVPAGVDMATWALAFALEHDAVTCVIPGCKDAAQVRSSARAAELASADHPQAVR